jgi:signal transduction histidine kinase
VHAVEAPNAMAKSLRTVLAITEELISCPDVDTMLRQAVEFARDRIGLERCAIFLEQDGIVRGTYGTDRFGHTTDEHGLAMDVNTGWHEYLERLTPEEAQWVVNEEKQVEWNGNGVVEIGRTGWVVHTRIRLGDGSRGILTNDGAISHAPLDVMKQEVTAVFCSLLGKIISHKQAEEEIRRALEKERDIVEIKSRIINNISHEFRTPMTIIQSSVELMDRYGSKLDAVQRTRHSDKIRGQIAQMTMLLDNTLMINRSEKIGLDFKPQPLDLIALCQAAVETVTATSTVDCDIRFSHSGPCTTQMHLDRMLLHQIVINLLTNALKFSRPGACVDLDLTCQADEVLIAVRDDGIGIPETDRLHLFQEFHRGKNAGSISGTGLGLSIVRRAAEAHGGSVAFASVEGGGSTFLVALPCEPVAVAVS